MRPWQTKIDGEFEDISCQCICWSDWHLIFSSSCWITISLHIRKPDSILIGTRKQHKAAESNLCFIMSNASLKQFWDALSPYYMRQPRQRDWGWELGRDAELRSGSSCLFESTDLMETVPPQPTNQPNILWSERLITHTWLENCRVFDIFTMKKKQQQKIWKCNPSHWTEVLCLKSCCRGTRVCYWTMFPATEYYSGCDTAWLMHANWTFNRDLTL